MLTFSAPTDRLSLLRWRQRRPRRPGVVRALWEPAKAPGPRQAPADERSRYRHPRCVHGATVQRWLHCGDAVVLIRPWAGGRPLSLRCDMAGGAVTAPCRAWPYGCGAGGPPGRAGSPKGTVVHSEPPPPPWPPLPPSLAEPSPEGHSCLFRVPAWLTYPFEPHIPGRTIACA